MFPAQEETVIAKDFHRQSPRSVTQRPLNLMVLMCLWPLLNRILSSERPQTQESLLGSIRLFDKLPHILGK